MKSIFDESTRQEIISRVNSLNADSKAQWGKMNVCQMAKHCTLADEMFLGKTQYKRVLMGRIFGKIGLKNMLKDDRPMPKNAPTSPLFRVTETGDLEAEKKAWVSALEQYAHFDNPTFAHWFFGPMTKEQIGQFAYKHNDHHLRQFAA